MKFQLIGWSLFVLCSILYIISNVLTRDWINLTGSIMFFIACLIFMFPLLEKKKNIEAIPTDTPYQK